MGFNDLILFDPVPSSPLDNIDEIETEARSRLAVRLQTKLRNVIDPGVDLKAATRAQAVKVVSDGDRFAIQHEDQAGVVNPQVAAEDDDPNEVGNLEQLFELSSGVPTVKADGRLVYRTISPDVLFGEQRRAIRTQQVEQAIAGSLGNDLVDVYDEAIHDVAQRTPRSG